jgi:D-sedoheptulose 7-phosphate isomerase
MKGLYTQGLSEHEALLSDLHEQTELLGQMARMLITALMDERRVYIFGNGGSAADAQHIAAELIGRLKRERRALPAIALTTDSSGLLAISNDYGFQHVFTRQVEGLVRAGDVVWALSTSGNSANIIEAVHAARAQQAVVIGFTGQSGKLKQLCDLCLCVNHASSDRIQEIHQIAYHLICDEVERHFAQT